MVSRPFEHLFRRTVHVPHVLVFHWVSGSRQHGGTVFSRSIASGCACPRFGNAPPFWWPAEGPVDRKGCPPCFPPIASFYI